VETFIEFLQNVVRGVDIQKAQFKGWPPDFSNPRIGSAMEYLRGHMTSSFWQSSGVPRLIPSKDNRQAYEEVFRYKLRVVWHRAKAENNNSQVAAKRLRSDNREFGKLTHVGTTMSFEPWCRRTDSALRWLESNTHKLRLCGIADCKSPYFIATASRKKYCSKYCQSSAEIERSKGRVRANAESKKAAALGGQGLKKRVLTPEGRERISKAAKAKAARLRLEKQKNERY
jgi:hypothetical protein